MPVAAFNSDQLRIPCVVDSGPSPEMLGAAG
jgi:hypothetical protein